MPFRHDVRTVTVPGLRRRLAGAPRALRAPAARRRAGAGDRPGGGRLPGLAAARRLAGAAGRRAPESAGRARGAGRPAGRARPPTGRGPHAAGRSPRAGGPGSTRGAFGEGLKALGTGLLHRRRPDPPPGRVGRAPGPRRLGASPLDAAAELAGLPHAGRGVDRAGARPARRPRRRPLGPPADRGGHRRRPRPSRGAPRRRRRRRPSSPPTASSPRRESISVDSTSNRRGHLPTADGDTTYLCAVDGDRHGRCRSSSRTRPASAAGWSSRARASTSTTGASGFNLEEGHPAEYGPGRRPPHTLCPACDDRADGALRGRVRHHGRRRPAADPAAAAGPAAP